MGEQALKKVDAQTMTATSPTPAQMLQTAIERGTDMSQLKELMDLQERWEANQARKEYVRAMAQFKSEPLTVKKGKHVRFTTQKGVTEYDHATLAGVVDAVVSTLSKYGFSHRWETTQENGLVTVSCVITHEMGHSESTTLSASPDDSGGKNKIQAVGSTVTYLQRYTLLAATGLAAGDMDNDAQIPQSGMSSKDADWLVAVDGCSTEDELKALKKKLVDDYGGVDVVPKHVRTACTERAKALK